MVDKKLCPVPFVLNLKQDVKHGVFISTLDLTEQQNQRVNQIFPITTTGLKYLLIASCNDLSQTVGISGKTTWKNPHGYLPGELYGFLNFVKILCAIYFGAGLIWMIFSLVYWKELMVLQRYVTIALVLGLLELIVRWVDFEVFNTIGSRSFEWMLLASIAHTLKLTVTRLLVLVVSMGFGIVKPSLGDIQVTIVGFGALFFVASLFQRVFDLLSQTSEKTTMKFMTMTPVAILDIFCFIWILTSMQQNMEHLERKSNELKLQLYKTFHRVLYVTAGLSMCWSGFYSWVLLWDNFNRYWEVRWVLDGFYDLLYVVVLLTIMILWRPNNNATQFAYKADPQTKEFS